jgi:DNA primase
VYAVAIPQVFLDELAARNPIEEVVGENVHLTRKGGNLFGLCPFHAEKTPSFSVAPDKQIYYCFGCHKGGGVISYIMERESLEFPDAVRYLAKRAGMEMPEDGSQASDYRRRERLQELCREAARYFHSVLYGPEGQAGRDYIFGKRALSQGTATRFGLGFAPDSWDGLIKAMGKKGYDKQDLLDAGLAVKSQKGGIYDRFRNRLMFPIIDVRGNVIGFGGRVMDDSTPKYLNSPETTIFNKRKNLFAMNVAKKSKAGYIILTEGYMDAIALHQYGFDCAVASLGTSLTQEHCTLLSKYTDQVVITYDGDEAGQNATKRAISMLEKTGMKVKVLRMQGAKDPDEFLKKYGAERFRKLLDRSENYMEYQMLSIQRQYDLTQDDQKVTYLKEAAKLISTLSSAVEREVYSVRAAEAAGVTPQAMELEVKKAYRQRTRQEKKKEERQNLSPAEQLQPQSRDIHYDNVRSAMAEEGLLRQVLTEPALFDQVGSLNGSWFSSPLLGRAFDALRQRHDNGLSVQLGTLGQDFTAEELSHLTAVAQRQEGPVNEQALRDYIQTISMEQERRDVRDAGDLLKMREKYQQKKGYGG